MLLGQAPLTVGIGLALGLHATWAQTRIIESQLHGIKPHAPVSSLMASVGIAGHGQPFIMMTARGGPDKTGKRYRPVTMGST